MDGRLLVLALGMFALGTDSFVIAGVLPEISRSYGITPGLAGQLTTVYAVTYALMAPTIAALAAEVPRKTLLLSGLAVFVAANLATALAPNVSLALVSRISAGFGAAMFAPTATGAASAIVPPDKRGLALSIVIAGLTASTALGTPIGSLIGGLGSWRWTMAFVSALAALAGLGIWFWLDRVPLPPKVTLLQRIAPIADRRVALTLLCTLLYQSGHFIVYTYFSVAFGRILGQGAWAISALLVLWGASGTVANLWAGRILDKVGGRKIIIAMLLILAADMALSPLASTNIWASVIVVSVWGAVAWGLLAPQQHRLVVAAPHAAPVVLGLNTSCTYLGVTVAGVVGAIGIHAIGPYDLGYLSVAFILAALVFAELATRTIAAATAGAAAVVKPSRQAT